MRKATAIFRRKPDLSLSWFSRGFPCAILVESGKYEVFVFVEGEKLKNAGKMARTNNELDPHI